MGYIGSVIKELRESAGVSRKALCQQICTEKYLYMIEKGTRTPSSEILKFIGNRLHKNLFEYYEYLDCETPIQTSRLIRQLNNARYLSQYDVIEECLTQAAALQDFDNEPWVYHATFNRLFVIAMRDRTYVQCETQIEALLTQIPEKYSGELIVVELYMLLSYTRQFLGKWDSAMQAFAQGEEMAACGASKIPDLYITLLINKLLLNFRLCNYEQALLDGVKLYNFQEKHNRYRRIFFTCFLLAFTNHALNNRNGAMQWFKKGVHIALFTKISNFVQLTHYEEFPSLLHDEQMPASLAEELIAMYGLNC